MTGRWWLMDVGDLHREAPYTFYQPSALLVERLARDDLVKLIFAFASDDPEAPGAERMWVRITDREGDRFTGVLDNVPRYIRGLQLDDGVEFEGRHIADTSLGEDDGLGRYRARCFVTRRVLHDGVRAGFIFREAADAEDDSGWRISAGDEPDEYMADADNIVYTSLGQVLNRDDAFLHLLDSPQGSAFELDPATDTFVEVDPPEPE
jgi:hypothetical protein